MVTTVINKYKTIPEKDSISIMRPGPWGNPFIIGKDGGRHEVVEKYRELVLSDRQLQHKIVEELRGKQLVCCCKPAECHGDILALIAESEEHESVDLNGNPYAVRVVYDKGQWKALCSFKLDNSQ
jgi:hypothetical protein